MKILSGKNKYLVNAVLTLTIVIFVYWLLNHQNQIPVSAWLIKNLGFLKQFYIVSPVSAVIFFCLAHFFSATLSIPGSCTTLNILSGAIFGYERGCVIVYLVTILSGCVGYYIGTKLPLHMLRRKYSTQIELMKKNILVQDYGYLTMIRLSPFLPYGVLNMLFGFLKVPFFLYLVTTIVGIFFDVVLLNSVGAIISGNPASTWQSKRNLAIVFLVLFISSYFVKIFKSKWVVSNSTSKREQ
jgi:uncharacterized membrane protein YdjX (TVP38/TMEM64 family)